MGINNLNTRSVLIALPPDGGYAWVIVFASFMVNFVIDGIIYSFGNTMIVLDKEIGSPEQISFIGSFQQSLYYLIGPITSAFLNRFGFRIVAFSGAVTTFVGILSASFVSSYYNLLLWYGLIGGLGFGIMFPPSIIIIGYNFEKYRAISTGLALSGSSFGVLCLAPLFNFITHNYDWRTTIRLQSACLIICMIASMAYRPLKPVKVTVSEVVEEPSSLKSSVISVSEFDQLYDDSKTDVTPGSNKSINCNIATENSTNHQHQISKNKINFFKCINKEKTHLINNETKTTGPLDRKDIFYSGSLTLLTEYADDRADQRLRKDSENVGRSLNYHLSMIHGSKSGLKVDNRCYGSNAIKSALELLFDVSILKSPAFLTFAMSNFFYVFGLYVPYMLIEKRAHSHHIPETYSKWFISTIAVGNFIGRLSSGVIGSMFTTIHPCYLIGFPSMIAGTITIISAVVLEDNIQFQFVSCFLMGYFIAFMVTLRAIVIVYLLGLEKLTNGFGLNMMTMGFSGLLGVPLATAISEATNTYTYSFILTGCFFALSGALMISALQVHKWKQRKN